MPRVNAESYCTTLHHAVPRCTTLHHAAPHCATLQQTAANCCFRSTPIAMKSRHMPVSHFTCSWATSHVNESCHMLMSCHVTCHTSMMQDTVGSQSRPQRTVKMNCSVLQCIALRCSVLQCATVRCSALQRVAVSRRVAVYYDALQNSFLCSPWSRNDIALCHHSMPYQSMSHVTCRRVMSHVNGSCHISMGPVKCQWVMSHLKWYRSMGESRHIKGHMSHVILSSCPLCRRHITYKKVGSRKNESCRIKIKDAKHESRHTYIYGTHL